MRGEQNKNSRQRLGGCIASGFNARCHMMAHCAVGDADMRVVPAVAQGKWQPAKT